MLNDMVYDLMEQLVEESQSLYRIKNDYKKDSQECGECMEFWNKMEKDKESHIKDLKELISSQMDRV